MFHVEHLHISKKYSTFVATFIFVFSFWCGGSCEISAVFQNKRKDVQDNETVYAKEDSKTEEKGIGKGILFAGAAILVVIIAGTIVIKRKK